MFDRILVPLDGSALAERAVAVAASIAHAGHAQVCLLRVVPLPAAYSPYVIMFDDATPRSMDRAREQAIDYLRHVAGSSELEGLAVTADVAVGMPATAILDAVSLLDADLVVMSTHDRQGMARWALGSVAQHVARYCHAPVMLLHGNGEEGQISTSGEGHLAQVLVPLDGSPVAEIALGPAIALGRALAGHGRYALHLVSIVDPRAAAFDCVPEPVAIGRAEGYLSGIAARIEAERPPQLTLPVTISVVVESEVAAAILRAAEGRIGQGSPGEIASCDLVAMTTHVRGGLARWVLGSVTERVLQGGGVPVLVVRPVVSMAEVSTAVVAR